jgi:hypothetical protein
MGSVSAATFAYATYWILLGLYVLSFIFKTGPLALWLIASAIIAVTLQLYRRKPIYALCTLPGSLMLGVITRVDFGGANLQFGDLHLLAVTLMVFGSRMGGGRVFVGKAGLMPLVVVLLTVSWLMSVDVAASTITIASLVELFLVYYLTLNVVKSEQDGATMLRAWWGTITICSMLVIVSYARAEPLILDVDPSYEGLVTGFGDLKSTSTFFLRASFFTTAFNYPLACTLVMLVVYLLRGRGSLTARVLWFGALLINIGTAVLLGNKSIIGAVAGASLIVIIYLSRYKRAWLAFAGVGAAFFLVIRASSAYIERIIEPRQLLLFLDRFSSNESFYERIVTWNSVVETVVTSPHALLIGLGPDASTRGRAEDFAGILGPQHGVDNAYLFVLLNYGIIILAIYVWYLLAIFRSLIPKLTGSHRVIVVMLLGSALAWLILGVGQQFGAAKAMGMGFQLAALVELIRARRLGLTPNP